LESAGWNAHALAVRANAPHGADWSRRIAVGWKTAAG